MDSMEKDSWAEEDHVELTEVVESEEDKAKHRADEDIDSLKEQIETLQDKILRAMAESENVRRRYEKINEETRDYAITSFAKDLITVMDNLYRALEYKDSNHHDKDAIKNIVTGVEMTKQELESIFQRHGILSINPTPGLKFDYNLHQAVSQVLTDEYDADSVVNILQVGYQIKGRLLRPAIVTVSKNQSNENQNIEL